MVPQTLPYRRNSPALRSIGRDKSCVRSKPSTSASREWACRARWRGCGRRSGGRLVRCTRSGRAVVWLVVAASQWRGAYAFLLLCNAQIQLCKLGYWGGVFPFRSTRYNIGYIQPTVWRFMRWKPWLLFLLILVLVVLVALSDRQNTGGGDYRSPAPPQRVENNFIVVPPQDAATQAAPVSATSQRTGARSSPAPARAPRRVPPAPNYSGGCSCSSGNYCTGPRGGRYCITASGNKRYLRR